MKQRNDDLKKNFIDFYLINTLTMILLIYDDIDFWEKRQLEKVENIWTTVVLKIFSNWIKSLYFKKYSDNQIFYGIKNVEKIKTYIEEWKEFFKIIDEKWETFFLEIDKKPELEIRQEKHLNWEEIEEIEKIFIPFIIYKQDWYRKCISEGNMISSITNFYKEDKLIHQKYKKISWTNIKGRLLNLFK